MSEIENKEQIEISVALYLIDKIHYTKHTTIVETARTMALSYFDGDEEKMNSYIHENFKVGSEKYLKYLVCQELNYGALEILPCKERESGMRQCERLDPHTDGHYVSEHTQIHALLGNGYACGDVGSDFSVVDTKPRLTTLSL